MPDAFTDERGIAPPTAEELLKKKLPSLADEDAANMAAELESAAQVVVPQVAQLAQQAAAPVPNPSIEPRLEPEVAPASSPYGELADPQAFAQSKARLDKAQGMNFGDHLLNVISMTPRGGRIGSALKGIKSARARNALEDYKLRYDAMKADQAQKNEDRRFTEIDYPKAQREEAEYKGKQAVEAPLLDPKSVESQIRQRAAIEMFPQSTELIVKANGKTLDDMIGKSSLKDIYVQKQQNYRANMTNARMKETHADTLAQRDEKISEKRDAELRSAAAKAAKDLDNNYQIKELTKQNVAGSMMNQLVESARSGNTIASNAMGAKAARAMGEVGVLTQEDVQRYVQSGQLTRGAADKVSKWMTGKPTEATLSEIQEISSILQSQYNSKVQPIYNQHIERFSKIQKVSPEEAAELMAYDYNPSVGSFGKSGGKESGENTEETVKVKSPTGEIGTIPKANLQKALDRKFTLVE